MPDAVRFTVTTRVVLILLAAGGLAVAPAPAVGGPLSSWVIGKWTYRAGEFTDTHEFLEGGKARGGPDGRVVGTWKLEGGLLKVNWPHNGWRNEYKVSGPSQVLKGNSISPDGRQKVPSTLVAARAEPPFEIPPVKPRYEICVTQLVAAGVPPQAAMVQCAALDPARAQPDPSLPPRISGLWSFRGGLPGEVELRQLDDGTRVWGRITFANGRTAELGGELTVQRDVYGEYQWTLRYDWWSPDAGGRGYLVYDRMYGNVLLGQWEMHYPQRLSEHWALER